MPHAAAAHARVRLGAPGSSGEGKSTVRKAGIPWNLPTGERIMVRNVRCCARCAKRAATSCNAKDIRSGRATGTK